MIGLSPPRVHSHAKLLVMLSPGRLYDLPAHVLDLEPVKDRVEVCKRQLESMPGSTAVLADLEIVGARVGHHLRRTRRFEWMVYAALWDSSGRWVDFAQPLAWRSTFSRHWTATPDPYAAVDAAADFALRHLRQ